MPDEQEMPSESSATWQRVMDQRRARFRQVVTQAQATQEEVHRILLLNLTTRPRIDHTELALSWMQRDPSAWPGYHPEECENAARATGHGEDV